MNELKEEIKKNVIAAQASTNKFAEDPLWESQAWFLRTRLKFGNDYQKFWDHTQGQINDYVTNLNSEDQQAARAEVAESFTLALKSGFDDCNKQVDSLLKKVFQGVKKLEDDNNNTDEKKEPEIISLIDIEDESINIRKRADPPSKDDVEKVDPEPSQENHTVSSSIVAVLEESITEEEDDFREEIIGGSGKVIDDPLIVHPRNDRLELAPPHRRVESEIVILEDEVQPEITSLLEEPTGLIEHPLEKICEVIDLTNEAEVYQDEEIGESLVVEDSRYDDEPTSEQSHSRGLSLTQILLDTYNEETQDSPERSIWYNNTTLYMALSSIVSRDTEDEDEPATIRTVLSKSKDLFGSALGLSTPAPVDSPESPDDVNVGREGANDSADRVGAEVYLSVPGRSQMEPIDVTQVL